MIAQPRHTLKRSLATLAALMLLAAPASAQFGEEEEGYRFGEGGYEDSVGGYYNELGEEAEYTDDYTGYYGEEEEEEEDDWF
jgi:hypothetical protein